MDYGAVVLADGPESSQVDHAGEACETGCAGEENGGGARGSGHDEEEDAGDEQDSKYGDTGDSR